MVLPLLLLAVAAAPTERPIQIAVPGFSPVNVTPEVASFYSEHFATKLQTSGAGVVTQKQMQTLLGLERQKQLLGCASEAESCLAELSNALGVDAVVQGEIGKFADSFQLNVKIIDARTAKPLSILSERVTGEDKVLDLLEEQAPRMVREAAVGLGRKPPQEAQSTAPLSKKKLAIIPGVIAVAALGGAVVVGLQSNERFNAVRDAPPTTTLAAARSDAYRGEQLRNVALVLAGTAVVSGAVAAFLFTRDEAPVLTPSVSVGEGAGALSVIGRFP